MKAYTRKQKIIARSSAEAVFSAPALGASAAKGVQSMMCDLGFAVKPLLIIDAEATEHILHRHGIGKMKHIDVAHLWLQDEVKSNSLRVRRVIRVSVVCVDVQENLRLGDVKCHWSQLVAMPDSSSNSSSGSVACEATLCLWRSSDRVVTANGLQDLIDEENAVGNGTIVFRILVGSSGPEGQRLEHRSGSHQNLGNVRSRQKVLGVEWWIYLVVQKHVSAVVDVQAS